MAYMIPETVPRKATAGERLLFQTFKEHLPSDYIVYYEPVINGRKPDYVIIGPDLGMVVLEVKDYTENTLFELYSEEWRIYTSLGQLETVTNPIKKARDYAFQISNQLKKDKNLVQLDGSYYGYLKFPFGFGVVLTRMKQIHIVKHELHRVIHPKFILTRDEIDPEDESFSADHLIEKILDMFTVRLKRIYIMTENDIKAIRYHLFPEVRISVERSEAAYYNDQLLLSLHNIKAMDLHQESLARQLGDKNRLIRGVAGSGKTLILASRAKMLAKNNPNWRILVLCFAIPLSIVIQSMVDKLFEEPDDLLDLITTETLINKANIYKEKIRVYTFHEWLKNELNIKDDSVIPSLVEKLDAGEIILPKYDAILIDEGQDFEPIWLKLISQVLNPETQSLLLVEDKAQEIFKRKVNLSQNTGLDFRGRSKILNINYRNTAQIVTFAWDFYRTHSQLQDKVKDGTVEGVQIIPPQFTKRKGLEPNVRCFKSFAEEVSWVVKNIEKLHRENKIPYSEMAVLYRVKNSYHTSYIDILKLELSRNNLPYNWITESQTSKRCFNRSEDVVKISTLDSAKGLDFRVVFILNIDNMPFALEQNEEREVSLLYIGMTRATDWLFLSYSGESKFTKYLDEITKQRSHALVTNAKDGVG